MLAKANRLTRGADYRRVSRRGLRSAGPHLVTHIEFTDEPRPARFGFIVTRAVGDAVRRNTVRRRLKAICAEALPDVREGADIVIRALPSSARAPFAELRSQVLRGLKRRGAFEAVSPGGRPEPAS
ncbi:ribonuclease P protein component [Microbacterium halotolerans]|uniref:ribonuclease P protein component n=1 Tax=Microbacterium halotolerans TaxID=246613 RepID=UPI000E6AE1C1|nr:ribonuclease P protein component [Microbacterium halotolerans]